MSEDPLMTKEQEKKEPTLLSRFLTRGNIPIFLYASLTMAGYLLSSSPDIFVWRMLALTYASGSFISTIADKTGVIFNTPKRFTFLPMMMSLLMILQMYCRVILVS